MALSKTFYCIGICLFTVLWNFIYRMTMTVTKKFFSKFFLYSKVINNSLILCSSVLRGIQVFINAHVKNALKYQKLFTRFSFFQLLDSVTLRWLVCFFKIVCISFPNVFVVYIPYGTLIILKYFLYSQSFNCFSKFLKLILSVLLWMTPCKIWIVPHASVIIWNSSINYP